MVAKNQVYSWRVSSSTKARLEELARRDQRTLAELLDKIVAESLDAEAGADTSDAVRQLELHARAAAFNGSINGPDPSRSENVRVLVRERLERRGRAR